MTEIMRSISRDMITVETSKLYLYVKMQLCVCPFTKVKICHSKTHNIILIQQA